MARGNAVYVISVAAELAGVHPQTLRAYERKGLIEPARTSGGTRRYSEVDVDRVQLIQELTQRDGVNLAGVIRILEQQDEIDELRQRVADAEAVTARLRREAARASREARRTSTGVELVPYQAPAAIERHPSSRRRTLPPAQPLPDPGRRPR